MGIPSKPRNIYYSGESKSWEIVNYKIEATPKEFKTYEDTIYMKGHSEYLANYFKVRAYIVFNEKLFRDHLLYEFELTPKDQLLLLEKIY